MLTKNGTKHLERTICNYCQKKLGEDTKNGTKHLHDHFGSCPLRKTRDIKQHILKHKVDSKGKVAIMTYTFDVDVARKALASMITVHEYRLSIAEMNISKGLLELFNHCSKKLADIQ